MRLIDWITRRLCWRDWHWPRIYRGMMLDSTLGRRPWVWGYHSCYCGEVKVEIPNTRRRWHGELTSQAFDRAVRKMWES